ncbi:hypothetical protein N779_26955 [Vibrio coralliilyticus OCN008]|nr:hypothetical protein N779_26955 [Vibrio coralliilyticus OCN008]
MCKAAHLETSPDENIQPEPHGSGQSEPYS